MSHHPTVPTQRAGSAIHGGRLPSMPLSACFAVLLVLALAAAPAVQAQILVLPGDTSGWLIGPFGIPPQAGFVEGPGMPPFGTGSYETVITVAASKQILARNDFHDLPLSGLTAFSYWTWIDPAATDTSNWYVNIYVDADGDGISDTRLDYVPPSAMVMTGVWQQWDAFTGTWNVDPGGTSTLVDFLAANPNARINAFNTPDGGAIRFNMGDTAANYVGFDGNLDGIRIAHEGVGDRTWDFEAAAPPSVLEIPSLSPAGLSILVLLLLAAGAWTLRRRTA